MSGELINTSRFIKQRNICANGLAGFSSGSINDLLDVNGDGETSGVEKDRMESAGVINTIESIHPAVARAFQDDTFALQTGQFLTQQQQRNRRKLELLVNRAVLNQRLIDEQAPERPDLQPIDELDILKNEELDTADLAGDIENRQYLTQGELDNQV